MPCGEQCARLDPAAVRMTAQRRRHDDGPGGDLAHRLAPHDDLRLPTRQHEGGGGDRSLVEQAVAGLQLAGAGPPHNTAWSATEKLPRKSAGCVRLRLRARLVLA